MESQEVIFSVSQDDFSQALSWVAKNTPANAAMPILRGVLIKASDSHLEILGTDQETSSQAIVNADVSQPGNVLIPGHIIASIVNVLPNKAVEVHYNGTKVLLKCGSSRFELPAMNLEDYPLLPSQPAASGTVNAALFSTAISQVVVAAGSDPTLPFLTGVRMEIDGSRVTMIATDRFRLAVRSFDWTPQNPEAVAEMLIPAAYLSETARTIGSNNGEPITIAAGQDEEMGNTGLIGIQADRRQTTNRLLDSEFPKVSHLIPQEHRSLATVDINQLRDAIKRVSLVATNNSQIRMEFKDQSVILSAGGADEGRAEESLECEFYGEELLVAFNAKYLQDGLKEIAAESDNVVFGFTEGSRSAILIPEPADMPVVGSSGPFATPETDFLYLLMPVRLPN